MTGCRQLDLRRSHARLRMQRSLYRAPRAPQGDVPLPPCDRRSGTAACLPGGSLSTPELLLARSRYPRCCKSSSVSPIIAAASVASSDSRSCSRSGNWRDCPVITAWMPPGATPVILLRLSCAPSARGATSAPDATIRPPAPPSTAPRPTPILMRFRRPSTAGWRRVLPTPPHWPPMASACAAPTPERRRVPDRVLVSHHDKQPIKSLVFTDTGGEIAAVLALLEQVDISGSVITLDALHTTRDTATAILLRHRAHYLLSVKGNASETYATLHTIDWEQAATASFCEQSSKGPWPHREAPHPDHGTRVRQCSTTHRSSRCFASSATATRSRPAPILTKWPTGSPRCP